MFDPVTAVISAVASGGLGLIGAGIQGNAAQSAADKQVQAMKDSLAMQQQMYNQTRSDLAPYRNAGGQAVLNQLSQLAMNPFDFSFDQSDPGYQWRMKQGLDAVNASAAAKGGYFSGGTGRALTDYSQGLASQEYQNSYNRALGSRQNNFGELSWLAGMGQNAAAQTGNLGAQYSGGMANTMAGIGNAQAGGILGGANALYGGLQNLNNSFQNMLTPFQLQALMKSAQGTGTMPQFAPTSMVG